MKKIICLLLLVGIMVNINNAEEPNLTGWTPIRIGIWNKIFYPYKLNTYGLDFGPVLTISDGKICGIQFGTLGCSGKEINGLQIGPLIAAAERLYGIQISGWGSFAEDMYGIQFSMLGNNTIFGGKGKRREGLEYRFTGIQLAFLNEADVGKGIQIGVLNRSLNHTGIQIGVVNHCNVLKGIQIGALNIIRQGGILPVMVGLNASF